MTETTLDGFNCALCGRRFAHEQLMEANLVRPAIAELIRKVAPAWNEDSHICFEDLHRLHWQHVEELLRDDRGELSTLEHDVFESLQRHEVLAADLNSEFETQLTLGQRIADHVADFGGSWTFIISFGVVLFLWVGLNSLSYFWQPFDPFPFIFLNLILSCIAALQAPVIMMSQNRQEAKDRMRAEHDYRVNLKAELEIRHLHYKIDHILNRQWQRLIEIQELQLELMNEIADQRPRSTVKSRDPSQADPGT